MIKKLLLISTTLFIFSFTTQRKPDYWALVLELKDWTEIRGALLMRDDSISKKIVKLIDDKNHFVKIK